MSSPANPTIQGKLSLNKPNKVFTVPTSFESDFFEKWCTFLEPFVHLTPRENAVMASLLRHRYELSKEISDPTILDELLMSDRIKQEIIAECNITLQYFHVVISNLRKKKIVIDNAIHPKLIPPIKKECHGYFFLTIVFKDEKAIENDLQGDYQKGS